MKRERYQNGTVYLDKRVGLWYFQWYDEGRRKPIGPITQYSNKTQATKAAVAAGFRDQANLKAKLQRKERSFEADRTAVHGGKDAYPRWRL